MYHGKDDDTVPPSSSMSTYNKFIANGAATVTLTELDGDRRGAFIPYAFDIVEKLISVQQTSTATARRQLVS